METIFSKIINGELPCDKVYENESILVIKDLYPKAPVHLLIIPKKAIKDFQSLQPTDMPLIEEIIGLVHLLAVQFNIADGYRFLTNNGASAGQTIFHLHFHLIGGKELGHIA